MPSELYQQLKAFKKRTEDSPKTAVYGLILIILLSIHTTGISQVLKPDQQSRDHHFVEKVPKRHLRLCGIERPPFTYKDGNSLTHGITLDIYREVFLRLNISFSAHELPWLRCLKGVKEGRYDVVINSRKRAGYLYNRYPTAIYAIAAFVRKDFPEQTLLWDELPQAKVGLLRGIHYPPSMIKKSLTKRFFAGYEHQLIKMLAAGRYDYIMLDALSAPILANSMGIKIRQLKPLMSSSPLFPAFNPQLTNIADLFDQAMASMIDDGTLDKIYRHRLRYSYQEISQIVDGLYHHLQLERSTQLQSLSR